MFAMVDNLSSTAYIGENFAGYIRSLKIQQRVICPHKVFVSDNINESCGADNLACPSKTWGSTIVAN